MKKTKKAPPATDSKCRALTSLNQPEYDRLLSVFNRLVSQKLYCYTLKGKPRKSKAFKESRNSSLYGSNSKLNFILMYIKENPNQSYQAYNFGISQAKVSEWVAFLTPVLETSLKQMSFMPATGDNYRPPQDNHDFLLVDVTERQVSRRTDDDGQQEEYSGKKKLHTVKNLAITTPEGYITYLSNSYEGATHDKTIWDELKIGQTPLNLLADLGFQGIDKGHPNVILPFKKPKGAELSDMRKAINKEISSLRIRIEHAFSGMKRLKIIRDKIRLRTYEIRDRMCRIAAALHNLRLTLRKPIANHS